MIAEIQIGQPYGDSVWSLPINALSTSKNGWPLRPFEIVSLLDVLTIDACKFVEAIENLQYSITYANCAEVETLIPDSERDAFRSFVQAAAKQCTHMGFSVSAALLNEASFRLSPENADVWKFTYRDLQHEVEALKRAIHTELKVALFLQVPAASVAYYDDMPQFGEAVTTKFSKAVTDIQESAKSFATGRYTATVFHLMRVMENATQHLGKKLNINLVGEKNWHNILDEVDKAIKALPVANSSQKRKRNRFAESSAHLRMVKDAWRNDVMHPKETYTEEEAERVFRNVKDFMVHLATKL